MKLVYATVSFAIVYRTIIWFSGGTQNTDKLAVKKKRTK